MAPKPKKELTPEELEQKRLRQLEYQKKYAAEHKELIAERGKKYREKNKKKIKAYFKKYYAQKKDEISEQRKIRYKEDPSYRKMRMTWVKNSQQRRAKAPILPQGKPI